MECNFDRKSDKYMKSIWALKKKIWRSLNKDNFSFDN